MCNSKVSFFSATSHGKNLSDPDENVDSVDVNTDGIVDRIVFLHSVDRMPFGTMNDLLRIVQHEATKEDQTTVQSHGVYTSPESSSRGEKCACYGAHEDNAKAHGQRATHVQKLVTGCCCGNGCQTTDHACGVPCSPGDDRTS